MDKTPEDHITLEELVETVRDAIRSRPEMIKDVVESWNKNDSMPGRQPLTEKEYLMEVAGFDSAEADALIARM